MNYAISSAQPVQLYRYADVARRIDRELAAESGSLGACLRHFEATCREPGYSIGVSYLADALRAYAYAAEPVDQWVHTVGRGFERADRRSIVQIIAQWVKGGRSAIFCLRVGRSTRPFDRYVGLTLRSRGDSPLGYHAQIIIYRASFTRQPVSPLWLLFFRVNWALSRVVWSLRPLIFKFHWARFWKWLLWSRLPIEPTLQPPPPVLDDIPPLPVLDEPAVEKVMPEVPPADPWTQEDARNFVLNDHGRLPGKEQCVAWAVERAKKISGMELVPISLYNPENWGAYNYIDIYADSIIKFSRENAQATLAAIGAGAVLVYDKGQARADGAYGHVAVIERVEAGGIWISDSNYNGPTPRFIKTEDLVRHGLYILPAGAKPVSKDRYEESRRRRRQQ